MAVQPPAYLASLKSNIRSRLIPWEGALRAGDITEDQCARINRIKSLQSNRRKELVEGDIDGFRDLFVGGSGRPGVFESASKNTKVIQYLLVLLDDVLQETPLLGRAMARQTPDPYQHLLPLLGHSISSEDPTPLLAATTMSTLMAAASDSSSAAHAALPTILNFLSFLVRNTDANMQDVAVQQYSTLLYGRETRQRFWVQRSETVKPLVDILRSAAGISAAGGTESSANLWRTGQTSIRSTGFEGSLGGGVGLQLLYHVLLVMWQLSFDADDLGNDLNDEYDIILLYTQLLRLSPKEKTTRLILSTLNNLVTANPKTLLSTAALANLPSLLENLSTRHLTDDDLVEDLRAVRGLLEEHARTKTTFDEYVAEVETGHLRPSPPHRNPTFWAENARRILDHENGAVLRKLAEIMAQPWDHDKNVLAIACNDVGYLVREAPERRYQLDKLGIKVRIMALMADPNENVRWESLRALGGWLKYTFDSK